LQITNMELIKQKLAIEGKLSISNIIKQILKDDMDNHAKKMMIVGERYYNGQHDILDHDFRASTVYEDDQTAYGTQIVNENNSNHHNVHNIYQQQVDQKTAYIIGKPPSITVEGAEKDSKLKAFEDRITAVSSDEEFADKLNDYITSASNKGVEWLHFYYDKNSLLHYTITPAEGIIPYYDTDYQEELTELIRYYSIVVINNGNEELRKKVEWWTKQDVTYYEETEKGEYVLDITRRPNPHAHWYNITTVDGVEKSVEPQSWGRVPFIPLFNNSRHSSDLMRIKGLQDAYNLISSATTNNQIDLVELYWLVQGYGGETAKAIQRKLQINKAVNISDPSGKITAEQVTLSVSDRIAWLKLLRDDMFRIGLAVDIDDDKLGNAPSGVSIAFMYTPLDLKSNMLIIKLKKAMKGFFWFITQDINIKEGTDYDSSLVLFDVKKSRITNEQETIQMIRDSQGLVPDTILLAKHPLVDDVNQAIADLKAQKKERAKMFLDDDTPPGDDEE